MSKQTRKLKPTELDDFGDEFEYDYDGEWGFDSKTEVRGRKPRKPVRGQSDKYKSAYYN